MGKAVRKFKWHWFINPLAVVSISNLLGTSDLYFIGPGSIDFYFSPFIKFAFLGLLVGWLLIVMYVGKEAIPPWYFISFWVIVLLLELAFSATLKYLNVGGFQTFGHI